MPWCETCNRFFNPNTLLPDGTCPNCGSQAAASQDASPRTARGPDGPDSVPQKVPWHFKLMVLATIGYVAWRIVEIIEQLVS
jgi:hypothetical protein